jgi:hypothetical protein
LTAAIEGTTVLVQEIELPATKPGGQVRHASRMIFLEGNGTVTTPDGKKSRKVKAGQMMVKFEDDPELPAPVDIDVGALVQGSPVMTGFNRDLPSNDLIMNVIQQQQTEIATGELNASGAGADLASQNSSYQNQAVQTGILESSANCEAVGNGFFLCYQPCPDCGNCEPLPGGGYVCHPP